MSALERHRRALRVADDWDAYLAAHSGLPGPRANLELVQAVADEGSEADFRRLLGSGDEFLVLCGTVGLGRLLAEGERSVLGELRRLANDERWRVREGVVLALQRCGDIDFDAFVAEMERWAQGTPLERRAAAAALCEPRLLRAPGRARRVLRLLDRLTAELGETDDDRVLRKALGYCWSVAIAADPEAGREAFVPWVASDDEDARWIVRENLKKARLARLGLFERP